MYHDLLPGLHAYHLALSPPRSGSSLNAAVVWPLNDFLVFVLKLLACRDNFLRLSSLSCLDLFPHILNFVSVALTLFSFQPCWTSVHTLVKSDGCFLLEFQIR